MEGISYGDYVGEGCGWWVLLGVGGRVYCFGVFSFLIWLCMLFSNCIWCVMLLKVRLLVFMIDGFWCNLIGLLVCMMLLLSSIWKYVELVVISGFWWVLGLCVWMILVLLYRLMMVLLLFILLRFVWVVICGWLGVYMCSVGYVML